LKYSKNWAVVCHLRNNLSRKYIVIWYGTMKLQFLIGEREAEDKKMM
jgi:hypothetical protein